MKKNSWIIKKRAVLGKQPRLGVKKISTLVAWNGSKLIQFFNTNQFSPSKTVYLEKPFDQKSSK